MSRIYLPVVLALVTIFAAASAARAADKDDALAAIKKLADAPNYSWSTTIEGGFGSPDPVEYKTEKDGYTAFPVVSPQGGDTTDVIMKGDKGVAKVGTWKTPNELIKAANDAGGFSPELIVLFRFGNFSTPAAQAKTLLEKATNLKKTGDVYTADLTEAAAKELLSFKWPAGVANTFPEMTVKDTKGTLKLTVKDGSLSKMEVHLTGSRNFNDQDNPVDQTTTSTMKDVGTTKITVPDEAKKKLAEAATQPAPTTAPATAPATKP